MIIFGKHVSDLWGTSVTEIRNKVIAAATGLTITPVTPFDTLNHPDLSSHVVITRYHVNPQTIDILHYDKGSVVILINNTATPIDHAPYLSDDGLYEYDTTIPDTYLIQINRNRDNIQTLSVNRHIDNREHGKHVFVSGTPHPHMNIDKFNVRRETYYHHGHCHNSRGFAFVDRVGAREHWQEQYWIHGTQVNPNDNDRIHQVIATSDPHKLTEYVRGPDSVYAYFAAHNPACPKEVKAEYALAGENFPH